jgi:hypothetical protein
MHMVTVYVGGKKLCEVMVSDDLRAALAVEAVEFRDDDGTPIRSIDGRLGVAEPIIPWEPGVTAEEIERRFAEPGLTYDEVRKRMGWSRHPSTSSTL